MNGSLETPTLLLEVTRIGGVPPAQPMQASFDRQGGTIGRHEDNDWVLPDPQRFISGRHALIGFSDGGYQVTDVSSNGVFHNHAETPLGREGEARLQPGDILTIGEYEIRVSLHQADTAGVGSGSFDTLDDPYARLLEEHAGSRLEQTSPSFVPGQDPMTSEPTFSLEETSPSLLEDDSPPMPPESSTSESDHVSDLNAFYQGSSLIPEDWLAEDKDGVTESPPPPRPVPETAARQTAAAAPAPVPARAADIPVPAEAELRRALARGMGLSHGLPEDLPLAELLENLGRIVRNSVEGTMSMLRARAQMKSEFRMSQTMIRPVENNPLKFSINTEEALRHIIDPRPNNGYLSPFAAFREAHEDSEAHMLAIMVGMQAALKAVVQRFKPENLAQRLGQSALLEKVPLYRQAKSWELFTELYSTIANEVEDDFQQVFGRAFSQAYEAQIRRLANLKSPGFENTPNNHTTQDRN